MDPLSEPPIDVFLSYARSDAALTDRLCTALAAVGVTVWIDREQIDDWSPITRRITAALHRSKVLLCVYSPTYPTKRYCQWELTWAYLCQHRDQQAADSPRVLVLNAAETPGDLTHIRPRILREALLPSLDPGSDDARLDALVTHVQRLCAALPGPMGDILTGGDRSTAHASMSPLSRPRRFVGRSNELWDVHDALEGDGKILHALEAEPAQSYGMAVVSGFAGVGKTLLADEYARRFADFYPGGVFRVVAGDGGQGVELQAQRRDRFIMDVADQLGVHNAGQPWSPDQWYRAVRDALHRKNLPYLWIIDDLPIGATSQDLQDWCAPSSLGRTLLTSRDQSDRGIGQPIVLDRLDHMAATHLLTADRPVIGSDTHPGRSEQQAVEDVLTAVGRHALAVDLAGRMMAVPPDESDYIASYADLAALVARQDNDAIELASALSFALPKDYEKSISRVMLASLRPIRTLRYGGEALDGLRLAAAVAPETPIPMDLLPATLHLIDTRPLEETKAATDAGIGVLHDRSLCGGGEEGYTVHALIARSVKFLMDAGRIDPLAEGARDALARFFPHHMMDIRAHEQISAYIPHAETLVRSITSHAGGMLCNAVGCYHAKRSALGLSLAYFTRATQGLGKTNGDVAEITLQVAANQIDALMRLHRTTEAIALGETLLAQSRAELPADSWVTTVVTGNLASAMGKAGRHADALAIQETVLSERQESLGADHEATLMAQANMGQTLVELGRYPEAAEYDEPALQRRRVVLGDTHQETLTSLNNVAHRLHQQGDNTRALAMYTELIEIQLEHSGADSVDTLFAQNNCAQVLRALGRLQDALALQRTVSEKRLSIIGPDHADTLSSRNNEALLLLDLDRKDEAETLLADSINRAEKVLGPLHSESLSLMTNYCILLTKCGRYQDALEIETNILEHKRLLYGAAHPSTLTAQNNLAQSLDDVGRYDEALALMEDLLERLTEVLPRSHPHISTTQANMACTLLHLDRLDEAEQLLAEVSRTQTTQLGGTHVGTLSAQHNHAVVLGKLGRLDEAIALMETVATERRRALGAEHADTLNSEAILGTMRTHADTQTGGQPKNDSGP